MFNDLEETFEFYGGEYLPEEWTIDDDQKAEWALGKIRAARAERDRVIKACEAEIKRYQGIIDASADKCERDTFNLKHKLFNFFSHQRLEGFTKSTKTQESYKLPSGKLKLKYSAPKINHDDETLATAYADYVEMVPKLKWGELKKRLSVNGSDVIDDETGEIVA